MKIKKDVSMAKLFKDIKPGSCFALRPYAVNQTYIKINENAAHLLDILYYCAVNITTGEIRIMKKK